MTTRDRLRICCVLGPENKRLNEGYRKYRNFLNKVIRKARNNFYKLQYKDTH